MPERGMPEWAAPGAVPAGWDGAEFGYLTTTGRRTGRPHEIEIWFGVEGGRIYLISGNGERADWVRNVAAEAAVRFRVGDDGRAGTARLVGDGGAHPARRVIAAKYQGWRPGQPLSAWAEGGALLEIELVAADGA